MRVNVYLPALPQLTTDLEELLTAMASPAAIVWVFLLLLSAFLWLTRRKGSAFILFFLWIVLTAAGNVYISSYMAGLLEGHYRDINPFDKDPFDAVVVLGADSGITPGESLNPAGAADRILLGARLYHAQITPLLIAAGGPEGEIAEVAVKVWRELKIPEKDIIKIPGKSTADEMRELAEVIDARALQRVGLVTSALQMHRAALASGKKQLDLHPLPAGFHGPAPDFDPIRLIPSAGPMKVTESVVRIMLERHFLNPLISDYATGSEANNPLISSTKEKILR